MTKPMATSDYDAARALYSQGHYAACLSLCEPLLDQPDCDARILHLVGLLCFHGGDVAAAIGLFQASLSQDPAYAEAYCNLALMLKKEGRHAEALAAYAQGLALAPHDAQAQYNHGLLLKLTGQTAEAVAALRRAAALNPLLPGLHDAIGDAEITLGRLDAAESAFRAAVAAHPNHPLGYRNLSLVLRRLDRRVEALAVLRCGVAALGLAVLGRDLAGMTEDGGDPTAAAAMLDEVLRLNPDDAQAWEALGLLRFRQARFPDALTAFQRALAVEPDAADVHMHIFTVAQILDQPDLALAHQNRALAITRLFTETGIDASRPRLLVLKAAGDWQVNLPTDFIIRREAWSVVHHYYVDETHAVAPASLPACDVVFNAIAEADLKRPELAAAAGVVAGLGRPCLNDPTRMAETKRETVALTMAGLPHSVVPASHRFTAAVAPAEIAAFLATGQLRYPLLLRPVGTHAGNGMALVEQPEQLAPALATIGAADVYCTQFVDYRSPDGLYRKYRIVVVDGQALPYHMAVSKRWMVHYYNAELDDRAMMDREEEHLLANFAAVFPAPLQEALAEMSRRLGLDVFAVDCAIAGDGRLVLFEVAVNAIIHLMDDPARYAYKHLYVPRIFDAVQAAILRRVGGL